MPKKQSIPCYVNNGGVHNIVNVPFGQFTRLHLKQFAQELLKSASTFETMYVAQVTEKNLKLLKGLVQILSLNLKPKQNRRGAIVLTAANEKNLKPSVPKQGNDEEVNLVSFALSVGLITLLFLLAAHIEYLESCAY